VQGRYHLALTAAVAYPVAYALTREEGPSVLLAAGVGLASLLPDLDTPHGLGARWFRVRWLSGVLARLAKHRSGWTHSAAACGAWALLWFLAATVVLAPAGQAQSLRGAAILGAVVLLGSLAHVLEDALPWGSRSGVPLWWPLSRRPVKFARPRGAPARILPAPTTTRPPRG
jgi:membrane-bound metal-dependent hydrolase YbcI (DUF457 family)